MEFAAFCAVGFLGADFLRTAEFHPLGTRRTAICEPCCHNGSMQQYHATQNTPGSGGNSSAAGFWYCQPATTVTKIALVVLAIFSLLSDVLLIGWDMSNLGSGMVPSLLLITLALVTQGWHVTAGATMVVTGALYCIFVLLRSSMLGSNCRFCRCPDHAEIPSWLSQCRGPVVPSSGMGPAARAGPLARLSADDWHRRRHRELFSKRHQT